MIWLLDVSVRSIVLYLKEGMQPGLTGRSPQVTYLELFGMKY